MVKHFDPTCPQCQKSFHVHHEDLRFANVQLLCPYCSKQFYIEESERVLEHDGTVSYPRRANRAK